MTNRPKSETVYYTVSVHNYGGVGEVSLFLAPGDSSGKQAKVWGGGREEDGESWCLQVGSDKQAKKLESVLH